MNGTALLRVLGRPALGRSGWKTDTAAAHRPWPGSVALAVAGAWRPAPHRAAPSRRSSRGPARAARSPPRSAVAPRRTRRSIQAGRQSGKHEALAGVVTAGAIARHVNRLR